MQKLLQYAPPYLSVMHQKIGPVTPHINICNPIANPNEKWKYLNFH